MTVALSLAPDGGILELIPGRRTHIACDAAAAHALLCRILTQSGETAAFCRADPALLAGLTLWENVALPLAIAGQSFRRAKPAALDALRSMEAGHAAHALPERLSDFERRQAALARALVGRPKLLVLDDVAASLNALDARRLFALLAAQSAFAGAAALFLGGRAPEYVSMRHVLTDGRLREVD